MKQPRRLPIMSLDELEGWFDTAKPAPHCRGVSMLNGFLTGLAAGPVFLLPNDWMWHVVGEHEQRAFIGNKMQAVIDTIVDHYNLIAHQLTRAGAYAPIYMRTDGEEVLADDWADGFFGAMNLSLEQWAPLFADKKAGEPLLTILTQTTNPQLAEIIATAYPKPLEPQLLFKEAWRALPKAVEAIYAYSKPLRFNPAAPANQA
ncbi:UPF0149 family protein [Rhizobium jaguaris]|uniref:YecA family protein n=1 Tax=Rhizobium jaguaris TaxID=1312183 RepID=A0A387FZ39_9HYPH|nr:UPF0149 family protein [Rhizobium jaguaris]AYG64320.1 YecA family protein [Rhizobium jaguaris]